MSEITPNIKCIVTDVDGTLLSHPGASISERDQAALAAAQQRGIIVTIATGRIFAVVERMAQSLGVIAPLITCNGADIRDAQRSYFLDHIPQDVVRDLILFPTHGDILRYLFSNNQIFCTQQDYSEGLFEKWRRSSVTYPVVVCDSQEEMLQRVQSQTQKALMWARNPQADPLLVKITQQFEHRCTIACGETFNREFTGLSVTKGVALEHLAQILDIEPQNILAIGDGENDADMLETAGIGVAMANALPKTLAAADYVTDSCKNSGVAQAIERFILSSSVY